MLKKIALVAAALAVSAPAFADRGGYRDHYRGQHRVVVHKPVHVVHRPVHVVHRPVRVVHQYYRPAPRPVYVVERHNHVNPVAFLAGAVIGAAIVHHVFTGY
jgi:hypothetical protein